MVSKRQREQRKNATAASLLWHKRQKLETQEDSAQFQPINDCHNDEPSDTDDMDKTDSGATWFWNDSANESQSDSEEEGDFDLEEESASDTEQSRTNAPYYAIIIGVNGRWVSTEKVLDTAL